MLEYTVEGLLVKRVVELGGLAIKTTPSRGFPDRLVLLPGGRVIFVECKRPRRGRISNHQMWWHERFRTLGIEVAVVRNSADIDQLLAK